MTQRVNIIVTPALILLVFAVGVFAQTTAFTYQGRLTDGVSAANGTYEMQFSLFSVSSGPGQIGSTITNSTVTVTNGTFTVTLDFGSNAFDGAGRWLEMAVRKASDPPGFTTLNPRQQITSSPYSIRTLNAAAADSLSAACVGCVQNANINSVAGTKVTGAVANATNASSATTAGNVTGIVAIANGGTGSSTQNFVDLSSNQTTIGGTKTFTGTVSANILNSATQYNIGGNRILSNPGSNNLIAGVFAGVNNAGSENTFVGAWAGSANFNANNNSFFGSFAGLSNTSGGDNTFIGWRAGSTNSSGNHNTFVGTAAGQNNTTGFGNLFAGFEAGAANTAGLFNVYIGDSAGRNSTGNDNAFLGHNAGFANSTAGANAFYGADSGKSNTTGEDNSFFGRSSGENNTTAGRNSFFGKGAGKANTTAGENSFFGYNAGLSNTTGNHNTFLGSEAGNANTEGIGHVFVGYRAGAANTTGIFSVFIGDSAGQSNLTGGSNTFVGHAAGENSTGADNSFFGAGVAANNVTGARNTFIGTEAGAGSATGNNNSALGFQAGHGAGSLNFATAIGANAIVNNSNSVVLGRAADTVRIPGNLIVTGSIAKGSGSFKIDHPLDPENKYLSHSFVESPDMMNVYNGNILTDSKGEAVVTLPDYFQVLNRDFRYQLTVIGQFAQAIVLEKIRDNRFKIKTDKPGVEVSWQVTGIRQDKFAGENRIPNEEMKPADEKGRCLYAPLCGGKALSDPINPKQ